MITQELEKELESYDVEVDACEIGDDEQVQVFCINNSDGLDWYCDTAIIALMALDELRAANYSRVEDVYDEVEWQENNDYNQW